MNDLEHAKEQLAASLEFIKWQKGTFDVNVEPARDWHRNNIKVQRKKIRDIKK